MPWDHLEEMSTSPHLHGSRSHRLADVLVLGAIIGLAALITATIVWVVVALRF